MSAVGALLLVLDADCDVRKDRATGECTGRLGASACSGGNDEVGAMVEGALEEALLGCVCKLGRHTKIEFCRINLRDGAPANT